MVLNQTMRRARCVLAAGSVRVAWALCAAAAVAVVAVAGGSGAHAQQPTAQEPEVVAEVDRSEVAVGERLNLTVTVTGGPLNPRLPELPDVDGLRLAGQPSMFRQSTLTNGSLTTLVSFRYPFVATREGTITIPPIEVVIGGRTYRTEDIQVRVYRGLGTEGAAPPSTGDSAPQSGAQEDQRYPAMFVRASVDDDRPYLGEQVTYTFQFYRRSVLSSFGQYGRPQYQPPDFSGFWNNQEIDETEYTKAFGFDRYTVVELQTVLFPSVVGTITIESAELSVPIDFYAPPNYLETEPILMQVRPLPTDAPAGFTGAVGRFDMTSEVDSTEGKVNEPVQLTVSISGEGNIEFLPDPAWPEFVDWRVFESPATDRSRVIDGRLVGARDYEVILVPQRAGELEIPRITYPFFNTETGEYTAAATDPIPMTIADPDGVTVPASDGAGGVERAGSDVRHIKAAPSSLPRQSGSGFVGSTAYWAVWGAPLLALALAAAWSRRKAMYDEAASRRRNALPEAHAAIALAAPATEDPAAVMADILLTYLSTRLGAPMGGLTHEALAQRLLEAGVSPDLAGRVEDVLSTGEVAKYGRASSDSAEFTGYYEMVGRLLDELDGAISE